MTAESRHTAQVKWHAGDVSRVLLHDNTSDEKSSFGVSLNDDAASYKNSALAAADLIDVACVLHVLDRAISTRKEARRHIEVEIPLRSHAAFESASDHLQCALRNCSFDRWKITFTSRREPCYRRYQSSMFGNQDDCEVALFSGGLDSLAGLVRRIRRSPEKQYVLIGTGSNREIIGLQRKLIDKLQGRLDQTHPVLRQTVIHPRGIADLSGTRNKTLRLRGLVFTMIGAAHAILMGEDRLHIYENGVGALNLPFAGGLMKTDHTMAVHPKTLHAISAFVSAVANQPFEIRNPFVFNTKAWMCEALDRFHLTDIAAYTISCDSKPRKDFDGKRVRHCGVCSSCLLRRQALSAANIRDETKYASQVSVERPGYDKGVSLRAMRSQLERIDSCLHHESPWFALASEFPCLIDVPFYLGDDPEIAENKVVDLYRDYVKEWKKCGNQVGVEISGKARSKIAA